MKKAINSQGIEVDVSDDTPVNTTNGVHYLLSESEITSLNQGVAISNAGAMKRAALAEIIRLEAEASKPRRIREALLGIDNGWLENQESLIVIERNKLGE